MIIYEIIALAVFMLFALWLATTAIGKILYILLFFAIIGLSVANSLGYGFGLEFGFKTFLLLVALVFLIEIT